MEQLNVVVSLITKENDYQRAQAAAAENTAQRLGVNVRILYANSDALEQSQQLLTLIQDRGKRPHGIVVEPVGTGMTQVATAAVNAGISWVMLNREVDYVSDLRRRSAAIVFAVSTDNEEVGRIQARQFAALLKHGGCVLYIEGPSTADVSRLRRAGLESTRPANVTIKSLRGDWTTESGYKAIQAWLRLSTSRQMHVGVIGCQNDAMAAGARQAFEEVGSSAERDQWLSLPFTGCDGLPETGQAWVRTGRLAATVVTPAITGVALEALVHALRSRVQPAERILTKPSSFPPIENLSSARTGQQDETTP